MSTELDRNTVLYMEIETGLDTITPVKKEMTRVMIDLGMTIKHEQVVTRGICNDWFLAMHGVKYIPTLEERADAVLQLHKAAKSMIKGLNDKGIHCRLNRITKPMT